MTYTQHRDTQEVLQTLDKLDIDDEAMNNEEELYKRFGWTDDYLNRSLSKWQQFKPKVWRIFDEPTSSRAAKVIAAISLFFLLVAIMVFCLKTHPSLRVYELDIVGAINLTAPAVHEEHRPVEKQKPFFKFQTEAIGIDKGNSRAHPMFMVIEAICNVSSVCEV
jgi:potassium voltage-gated channel Shaw-related subfamily C protein 1